MLHITNGDIVARKLRSSGLSGDVAISADVVYEGPCPTRADAMDFRETRARYLAERGYATYDEALEEAGSMDRRRAPAGVGTGVALERRS